MSHHAILRSATPVRITPDRLAEIALHTASHRIRWSDLLRFDDRRWYRRLARNDAYEIWLLSWLPGQETGFHDHGVSAGAFAVAHGSLHERVAPCGRQGAHRRLVQGEAHSFAAGYVHNVGNRSAVPAVSVHAYSPPLVSMRRFAADSAGQLRLTVEETAW